MENFPDTIFKSLIIGNNLVELTKIYIKNDFRNDNGLILDN